MFESIIKTKIASTSDLGQKAKITEVLSGANIDYSIKCQDNYSRNSFDSARIGRMMTKPKYVYDFYVNKKDAEYAIHLIRTI